MNKSRHRISGYQPAAFSRLANAARKKLPPSPVDVATILQLTGGTRKRFCKDPYRERRRPARRSDWERGRRYPSAAQTNPLRKAAPLFLPTPTTTSEVTDIIDRKLHKGPRRHQGRGHADLVREGRVETLETEHRLKSVPRPLPGSKRTRFSKWVQPWRRGAPPKANYQCLKRLSSEIGE